MGRERKKSGKLRVKKKRREEKIDDKERGTVK